MIPSRFRAGHGLAPYVASAGVVATVGLAGQALTRFLPLPHVSVLFLAAVVMSAAFWGFWPSVLSAVLSVGAGSFFFYSPIFSFHVADPEDIADLAVFVAVAAFTSRLAANVRAQALEARRRREAIAGLLAFAERLADSADDSGLHATIVEQLAPVLGSPIGLLLPGKDQACVAASVGDMQQASGELRPAAARLMGVGKATVPGWRLEPLDTAQGPAGVVAARLPAPAEDPEYVRGLLGQAALALERARLRREVAEARLKAQAEALREALLNSVSHELQTPVAAILGSASALQSLETPGVPHAQRELTATIREEAERLASYIDNVLHLTRIRSGQIAARPELVELADIVNAALRRKERLLAGHALEVDIPADLPMLRLDLFLMEQAVANVIDNSAKHAGPGCRLRIAARRQDAQVVLEISDNGSGIRAEDLQRVFEPFYRGTGPQGRLGAGTGLGLAICRAFVEANRGSVAALSAGLGQGTTVRITLPA